MTYKLWNVSFDRQQSAAETAPLSGTKEPIQLQILPSRQDSSDTLETPDTNATRQPVWETNRLDSFRPHGDVPATSAGTGTRLKQRASFEVPDEPSSL